MIYGMQIVIEARQRGFLGHQAAAIIQPTIDDEDFEARAREIAAEHETLMTRADDDAVIGLFKSLGHASSRRQFNCSVKLAAAA